MEIITRNDALKNRAPLFVDGYTHSNSTESFYLTRYFGQLPINVDPEQEIDSGKKINAQAYYVEQPPFSTVPAHYHDTNQFQIFFNGNITFGKKEIKSVALHYAGGHTPYGPIITKNKKADYLTLRNNWDSGGKKMPEMKKNLLNAPRIFYLIENIDCSQPKNIIPRRFVENYLIWDKFSTLGAKTISFVGDLSPNLNFPTQGFGKYCIVIDGEISINNTLLTSKSCIYIKPNEEVEIFSEKNVSTVLLLQFPSEVMNELNV